MFEMQYTYYPLPTDFMSFKYKIRKQTFTFLTEVQTNSFKFKLYTFIKTRNEFIFSFYVRTKSSIACLKLRFG